MKAAGGGQALGEPGSAPGLSPVPAGPAALLWLEGVAARELDA